MSTAEFKVTPADSVLSYLPLCHIAEKIFTLFIPLTSGAVTHLVNQLKPYNLTLRSLTNCLSRRSKNLGTHAFAYKSQMKDELAQGHSICGP